MRILQVSLISDPIAGSGQAELSRGDNADQIHATVRPAPKARYWVNLQKAGDDSIRIETNRPMVNGFLSGKISDPAALAQMAATLQECLENQKDPKRVEPYHQLLKLMAGVS